VTGHAANAGRANRNHRRLARARTQILRTLLLPVSMVSERGYTWLLTSRAIGSQLH
jgi:hypothetical protein